MVILNLFSIFIHHETLIFDDRDPQWFHKIKVLLGEWNKICKIIVVTKNWLIRKLNILQNHLTNSIADSKQKYIARMANKLISTKKTHDYTGLWWKRFLNNKKMPLILPLFYNKELITDYQEKSELFSSCFVD